MNPVKGLQDHRQAVWLDFLSRGFIADGRLKKLVDDDGLRGLTSDPSIFGHAIGQTDEYDDAIKATLQSRDYSAGKIFEKLAVEDIRNATDVLRPVFDTTRGADGFVSIEVPNGAGHFVKMIHNGIEYGLMQAFTEGFDILKNANSEALPHDERFDLNLPDIAETWRRGSVISSWLLDLIASALAADPKLAGFEGVVEDSGEGRWAIMAAIEEAVSADVLSAALYARFRSRRDHTVAEKILSAMRKGFGAHVEPKVEPKERKAKPS